MGACLSALQAKQTPAVTTAAARKRMITIAEVEQHSSDTSAWIVVKDKVKPVYDCTPFLDKHPGGKAAITMHAGQECTDDFIAAHSHAPWAWTLLEDFYIGDLVKGSAPVTNSDGATISSDLLTTLDPKKKVAVKLISKEVLSRDSRRLRFALPSPQHTLGLPIGSHLLVNATIDGTPCMRAYTPTSLDDDVGFVEMVIKVYFKNENPRFPDGGIMSQHLESLNIGDTIDIKGPVGHFEYLGKGKFKLHNKEVRQCSSMGMICGGTGITPAYQVIKAALKDKEDATQFYLLYANQTPADVLLRAQLDAWAKEHPARVHIWYTVDKVPEGTDWPFSVGFIDEEMIKKHMPKPGLNGESFVGMCGPPPMLKFACIPNLEKAGYTASDYMSF